MIILCELLLDPNPKATVGAMGTLIQTISLLYISGTLIQTISLLYISPSSLSLEVSTRVGNYLRANRPQRLG
jgi:MATE family multidrug resistance protein